MELHLSLALQTLITLFLTLYCLKTILKRTRKTISKPKPPPKISGGRPLMGHLSLLSGPELPHVTLSNLADKYGPIFTLQFGTRRAVVVSNHDIARECFTNQNDVIFSNRPKTQAIEYMGYDFAMFGFAEHGPYWRELRKITTTTLTSNRRVEELADAREFEVGAMTKSLYETCCGENNNNEKVVVEMKKVFEELTLNFMMRIVFGDVEEEMKEKLSGPIGEFFRGLGVMTLSDLVPIVKWLDCFGGAKKVFKKTSEKMDNVLQYMVEEHRKHGDDRRSFMRSMMDVADGVSREFPKFDSDTITKATCQVMILGGAETMSVTLTWALCFLLNNRRALERAQQELDKQIGRERLLKELDTENLVYIRAIVKETLRISPPAPLLFPRLSSEDTTVAGYHVPSGTQLIINAYKLQRDPNVWSDPLQFKPERFLDECKHTDVRGQDSELLPFGGGRRICPGISFSMQMMEFSLASLLHGFEIDTILSDEPVDMTGTPGGTNVKATPLEVLLKPRLSPAVYCA